MDEMKDLLDRMADGFEDFKTRYDAALTAERKEREDLERRINWRQLGGNRTQTDAGPEFKAINGFVRSGGPDWAQDTEIKGMSIGSDPDGGYLVLPAMSSGMTTRLFDMSPMRRISRIETVTKGDAFEEADDRDEAGATWVGELESRPDTETPQIGMIRIPLEEIYAQPKASQRLLDDTDRDLGAWLEGKLSDKFGRSEGDAFVNGDGIKKPRGFLTYDKVTTADSARPAGKLQYVASGTASAFPGTTPGDVLKNLMWSLRTPYRQGAVWLMNTSTASVIDSFKDANNNYIWRNSMAAGEPSTLLGYPVEIDEGMPNIGAGTFPVAFGNFKLGYCIVDRPGIKLLRDPYTDKPNVRFYAYKRVGGGLANDDAIKLLKIATS